MDKNIDTEIFTDAMDVGNNNKFNMDSNQDFTDNADVLVKDYEYSDEVIYLKKVVKNCYVYISPLLLILGTTGNFLSILVLKR